MFTDRIDAAFQLSKKLIDYKNTDGVVLAIPRGGVPIGKVVADALNLPLELIISKKISHPLSKEYAIGAVSLETRVLNDAEEVPEVYIEKETNRLRQLIRETYNWYFKNNEFIPLTNKTVIVVDDGIATGYTILSALELLHQHKPKKVVVAVPVASSHAVNLLKESPYVDEVLCLLTPDNFRAVGQFYIDFHPVTDDEVIKLLGKSDFYVT